MAYIKIPKGWEIPENQATSESDYINRRKFIKDLGIAGAGALLFSSSNACAQNKGVEKQLEPFRAQKLAAENNANFTVNRRMTDEITAATYNNYYEFTNRKALPCGGIKAVCRTTIFLMNRLRRLNRVLFTSP